MQDIRRRNNMLGAWNDEEVVNEYPDLDVNKWGIVPGLMVEHTLARMIKAIDELQVETKLVKKSKPKK
jgi:hypothetical protein